MTDWYLENQREFKHTNVFEFLIVLRLNFLVVLNREKL